MPRDVVFDAPWSIMSLLVYILVTSLIFVRLKWISTYFRNFKSIEALITSLIGACIETGVVLVLVQLILVVFLILDHPAVILVESIAAQTYVRASHLCSSFDSLPSLITSGWEY